MKSEYQFTILRDVSRKALIPRLTRTRMSGSLRKLVEVGLLASILVGFAGVAASPTIAKADVISDLVCVKGDSGQQNRWGDDNEKFGGIGGYTPAMTMLTKKASATKVVNTSGAAADSGKYRVTAYEKYGSSFPQFTTWTPAYTTEEFMFAGVDSTGGLGTGDSINSGSTAGSEPVTASDSRFLAQDLGRCGNLKGKAEMHIANGVISGIPRFIVDVSAFLYSTTSGIPLSDEANPMHFLLDVVEDIVGGLNDSLFLPFMLPMVLLGATYVAYVGIIKRAATKALTGTGWMIAAIAMGTFLLAQPTFMLNMADTLMTSVQSQINDQANSAAPTSEICEATGENVQKRESACTIWQAAIYAPWLEGQYGTYAFDDSDPRNILNNQNYTIRYGSETVTASSWGQFQLDRQATGMALQESEVAYAQLSGNAVGADTGGNKLWAGGQDAQTTAAGMMWLTSIVHSIVPLAFSFMQFCFQLMLLMAVLMSPFMFLLGIIPQWGTRVLKRYAEIVVNIFIKQIIATICLSVYFMLYSLIASAETKVMVQTVVIAGLVWATFFTRVQLQKIGSANFGGNKSVGLWGQGLFTNGAKLFGAIGGGIVAGGGGAILGGIKAGRAYQRDSADVKSDGGNPVADVKPRNIPNKEVVPAKVEPTQITPATMAAPAPKPAAAVGVAPAPRVEQAAAPAPFPSSDARLAPQKRETVVQQVATPKNVGAAAGVAATATAVGVPAAGVISAGASEVTKRVQAK